MPNEVVENKKSLTRRVKMIKDIAKTFGRTKGPKVLGKKWGVSKQYITQVAVELRKRGIDVPRIRWHFKKAVDIAVEELKKEK